MMRTRNPGSGPTLQCKKSLKKATLKDPLCRRNKQKKQKNPMFLSSYKEQKYDFQVIEKTIVSMLKLT